MFSDMLDVTMLHNHKKNFWLTRIAIAIGFVFENVLIRLMLMLVFATSSALPIGLRVVTCCELCVKLVPKY